MWKRLNNRALKASLKKQNKHRENANIFQVTRPLQYGEALDLSGVMAAGGEGGPPPRYRLYAVLVHHVRPFLEVYFRGKREGEGNEWRRAGKGGPPPRYRLYAVLVHHVCYFLCFYRERMR